MWVSGHVGGSGHVGEWACVSMRLCARVPCVHTRACVCVSGEEARPSGAGAGL